MAHILNDHERIVHRLKISHGHLKKIIEMAENDEYCIDIVHQSQAVQKALYEVNILLLEMYLKKRIPVDDYANRDDVIIEIMKIVRKGTQI